MHCSGCKPRGAGRRCYDGFTLVEAVVGIVLVAVFGTSTFLAFQVHNAQLRDADDTLAAVAVADAQLGVLLKGKAVPRRAVAGPVAGQPTWRWSLTPLRQQSLAGATVQTARFEIVRLQPRRRVLVSTEVVTHAVPPRLRGPGR